LSGTHAQATAFAEQLAMTSEPGLEAMLRAIWSEVLAVPQSSIARDASFFALGGDSVSIMQVMARMNERLFGDSGGQEIPITDFFAYPTIASLARRIAGAGPCEPTPEAQLHEAKSEESNAIAIVGMAGRFPGARNVEELWQNLRNGVTSM
jgi:acyl carrier protein